MFRFKKHLNYSTEEIKALSIKSFRILSLMIDIDIAREMMWDMACHGFDSTARDEKHNELILLNRDLEFFSEPLKYMRRVEDLSPVKIDDLGFAKAVKNYLRANVNGK